MDNWSRTPRKIFTNELLNFRHRRNKKTISNVNDIFIMKIYHTSMIKRKGNTLQFAIKGSYPGHKLFWYWSYSQTQFVTRWGHPKTSEMLLRLGRARLCTALFKVLNMGSNRVGPIRHTSQLSISSISAKETLTINQF